MKRPNIHTTVDDELSNEVASHIKLLGTNDWPLNFNSEATCLEYVVSVCFLLFFLHQSCYELIQNIEVPKQTEG